MPYKYLIIATIYLSQSCKKAGSDAPGSTTTTDTTSKVTVTTLASSGSNGAFTSGPRGIVEDSKGNFFISTDGGYILEMNALGMMSTFSGSVNLGCEAGAGTGATYTQPFDISIDDNDNIYVADHNCGGVKVVNSSGDSKVFCESDVSKGVYLSDPATIAVDNAGNVYVADEAGTDGIVLIDRTGKGSPFAGNQVSGDVDGPVTQAEFLAPTGMCTDANGDVYVADGNKIKRISGGQVSTYAGSGKTGYKDGSASEAMFGGGMGICLDGTGNMYVADFYNQCIRKISANGTVTTVAGVAGQWGHADGDGDKAMFSAPTHLCVDKEGNLIIADVGNGGGALSGEGFIRKITFKK